MKPLQLILKKEWYDMILSGEKTEEYREIKPYWLSRLCEYSISGCVKIGSFKPFKYVQFTNGYRSNSRTMLREIHGISIGEGRPEWGAEIGKKYIVINLKYTENPLLNEED